YEELELVLETLHASPDQDLEDAFDAAGAAIWDGGDRRAVEELDEIAIEAGASGFTSLDLITATGIVGPMRTESGWR
ncbi:MAG: hypothetical protein ACRDG9_13555, partial [Actinomycetota bacterium]